jgi:hypothetical protein
MKKSIPHQERARLRLSRTPEFYRQFVAAFAGSGLTLAQYCRKHQVGEIGSSANCLGPARNRSIWIPRSSKPYFPPALFKRTAASR